MTLASARPSEALAADLDRTRRTRELVERLIAEPALLGPDFTPIRRLDATSPGLAPVLGWKATGRGAPGTPVADTLSLLEHAQTLGLVERLDWAFRAHTFDVAVDSGLAGELHLTPEPETFGAPCPPRLAVAILRGRRSLDVCAELHDDAFADERRLLAAVDEMGSWGWHLVLADPADPGVRATALRLIDRIRPAYVQVDLGRRGRSTEAALAAWVEAAEQAGASLMALGVSTSAELDAALELGATYGRGALLGRPTSRPY